MPILSINYGIKYTSALYVKNNGEFDYKRLNYVYSPKLFSNSFNREKFYTDLTDHFIKKLKVTKAKLQVIATGFEPAPTIGLPYDKTTSYKELLSFDHNYYTYLLDKCTIITQDGFTSYHKSNVPLSDEINIQIFNSIKALCKRPDL